MTIEVRQLHIKAAVIRRPGEDTPPHTRRQDQEALKRELLEACRRLIADALRAEKGR